MQFSPAIHSSPFFDSTPALYGKQAGSTCYSGAVYTLSPDCVDPSTLYPRINSFLPQARSLPAWMSKTIQVTRDFWLQWAGPLAQVSILMAKGWRQIYHRLSTLACWILAGTPCTTDEAHHIISLAHPFLQLKDGTHQLTKQRLLFEWQQTDNLLARSEQIRACIETHFSNLPHLKVFPPTRAQIFRTLVAAKYITYLEMKLFSALEKSPMTGLNQQVFELGSQGSVLQALIRHDKAVIALLKKSACPSYTYPLLLTILKEQSKNQSKEDAFALPWNMTTLLNTWQLDERLNELGKTFKSPPWFAYLTHESSSELSFKLLPSIRPAIKIAQTALQQIQLMTDEFRYKWKNIYQVLLENLALLPQEIKTLYQKITTWASDYFAWTSCYFACPGHLHCELAEAKASLQPFFKSYPDLQQHNLIISLAKNLGVLRKLALELAQFNPHPQAYHNLKSALIANYTAKWIHQEAQNHVIKSLHRYLLPTEVYDDWLHTSLYEELCFVDDWSLRLLRSGQTPVQYYAELLQSYQIYESLLSPEVKECFDSSELSARIHGIHSTTSVAENPMLSSLTLCSPLEIETLPVSFSC